LEDDKRNETDNDGQMVCEVQQMAAKGSKEWREEVLLLLCPWKEWETGVPRESGRLVGEGKQRSTQDSEILVFGVDGRN